MLCKYYDKAIWTAEQALAELDKPGGIILNEGDGLIDEPDMPLGLKQDLHILDRGDIFMEPNILQKNELGEDKEVDEDEEVDENEEVDKEDLI